MTKEMNLDEESDANLDLYIIQAKNKNSYKTLSLFLEEKIKRLKLDIKKQEKKINYYKFGKQL